MGKAKTRPHILKGNLAKKPSKTKAAPKPAPIMLDKALFNQVPGIPEEAEIQKASAGLRPGDRAAFKRVRELLAEHLSSGAAARLWLISPCPQFMSNPLDAVRKGQAKQVLAMLESQWGRSPTYA